MALKCQNCGSTDIVTIAGQNLCINCGEKVKGDNVVAAKVEPKNTPVVAKTPVKEPQEDQKIEIKKPKAEVQKSPSITKFGSASNNKPAAKAPSVVNPPKKLKIEPIKDKSSDTPDPVPTYEKVAAAKPQPTKIEPSEPTRIDPPTQSKSTLIDNPNDILHPYPKPTPFDGSDSKVKRLKTDTIQPNEVKLENKRADDSGARVKPHPFQFTLKIGLPIGILAGLATSAVLWFNLDLDLTLYTLGAVAIVTLAFLALAQASLLYGLSRSQDGRPAVQKLWWRAGKGAFLEVVNANLISLIMLSVCVLAGLGVWQMIQQLPADPIYYRVVAGLFGYGAVVWVALGALSARHIAIPAIVIGSVNSISATAMGWRAFTHAGGHMVMAMIETTLVRLAVILSVSVAVVYGSRYLGGLTPETVSVVIGAAVSLTVILWYWLVLQVEASVWLKQYRQWVKLYFPENHIKLLSGRVQASKPH